MFLNNFIFQIQNFIQTWEECNLRRIGFRNYGVAYPNMPKQIGRYNNLILTYIHSFTFWLSVISYFSFEHFSFYTSQWCLRDFCAKADANMGIKEPFAERIQDEGCSRCKSEICCWHTFQLIQHHSRWQKTCQELQILTGTFLFSIS